jgi:uncharacterized membrane protein (DUF485 family)
MEFVFSFFLLLLLFSLFASFVPVEAIGSVILFFGFIAVAVLILNFVLVCIYGQTSEDPEEDDR